MAGITEGTIRHLIDSYIVDNQAHGITPAKMRDMMQQMVTYVISAVASGGGDAPGIADVLAINSDMSELNLLQTDNGAILKNSAGQQVIRMNGSQIELIGYNSPDGDAVGKITFNAITGQMRYYDGTEGEGKVLTSDASGNVTWQDLPDTGIREVSANGQTITCSIDASDGTGGIWLVCPSVHFYSVAGGSMVITVYFRNLNGGDEELTFYRQGQTITNMAIPGGVPIPPMTIQSQNGPSVIFTVAGTMAYDANVALVKLKSF